MLITDDGGIDEPFEQRLLKVLKRYRLQITKLSAFHVQETISGIPSVVDCYVSHLVTSHVLVSAMFGYSLDTVALTILQQFPPDRPPLLQRVG